MSIKKSYLKKILDQNILSGNIETFFQISLQMIFKLIS